MSTPACLPIRTPAQPLLAIEGLSVQLHDAQYNTSGISTPVRDLNLTLHAGETLGLIGESGSGKTLAMLAVMGLLPHAATAHGSVRFQGQQLLGASEQQLCALRGNSISMVFQEPMTALNPLQRVGDQVAEPLRLHQGLSKASARAQAIALLAQVGIADATQRWRDYPHQFSGGQRQRIAIASALACKPDLLIADEPTTALDVTVQAQIMTLLNELKRDFGTTIIMITHDLGVVAGICDQVLVMYAGRTMEYGKVDDIFYRPTHPYTIGLLGAVPRLDGKQDLLPTIPGNPPNLVRLPAGCPFQERCPHVHSPCRESAPALQANGHKGGLRACFWQQQGDAA